MSLKSQKINRLEHFMRSATKKTAILLLSIYLILLISLPALAVDIKTAKALMEKGDYPAAISLWDKLLKQPDTTKSPLKTMTILFERGEAYRIMGHHKDALDDLQKAYHLAQDNNTHWQAMIASSLGQLYYQAQHIDKSRHYIQQAIELAEQLKQPDLIATAYYLLANLSLPADPSVARGHYKKALDFAQQSNNQLLIARIQVSVSTMAADPSGQQKSMALKEAYQGLQSVPTTMESTLLKTNIAYQALEQGDLALSYMILNQALKDARHIDNDRLLSQVYGYLGRLYERKKRFNEALTLTQSAILTAQRAFATDLLLQWEWQQGRLEKALAHPMASLAAYRRALQHIEAIRMNIPINYQDGKSSFRTTMSPFYLQLIELLLTQAKQFPDDSKQNQAYLTEAMAVIERLKTSELQDYFKDACTIAQTQKLDFNNINSGIAVVYPIIFPDHLDVLVQIGTIKRHKRFSITSKKLNQVVTRLERSLRPSGNRLNSFAEKDSKILYDLIIKPWETLFQQNKINTLVYAPDGALRKVPLGALSNGQHFVIEHYAVAVIPGLTLMSSQTSRRQNIQALVAGLSKPGDVVSQLPASIMKGFFDIEVNKTSATRELNFRSLPDLENLPDKLQQSYKTRAISIQMDNTTSISKPVIKPKQKMQNALELPGVVPEVNSIADIMPSDVLLNEDFLLAAFDQKISENFRIVHIASHGFFSGTAEHSFVMTYDRLLDMNHLQDLFKSEAFSDAPVEILTLSACQTAQGDDRAPLGLSGIALKSGARSVIGSLWPIADEVARSFLPDFYSNLKNESLTKAQALQKAQIKLIQEKKYSHPSLWSAFILVGNWM